MNWGLLYISAATGCIVMIGSLLLIAKGRVMVDTTTQSIQEIELPLGFRLRSQSPFAIMFFFGTFLVFAPFYVVRQQYELIPNLSVTGKIPLKDAQDGARAEHKLRVLATVAYADNVFNDIRLNVPLLQSLNYRIYYYDDDHGYLYDEPLDWTKVAHGEYPLQGFVLDNHRLFGQVPKVVTANPPTARVNPVNPIKESRAEVEKFRTPEVSQ